MGAEALHIVFANIAGAAGVFRFCFCRLVTALPARASSGDGFGGKQSRYSCKAVCQTSRWLAAPERGGERLLYGMYVSINERADKDERERRIDIKLGRDSRLAGWSL